MVRLTIRRHKRESPNKIRWVCSLYVAHMSQAEVKGQTCLRIEEHSMYSFICFGISSYLIRTSQCHGEVCLLCTATGVSDIRLLKSINRHNIPHTYVTQYIIKYNTGKCRQNKVTPRSLQYFLFELEYNISYHVYIHL